MVNKLFINKCKLVIKINSKYFLDQIEQIIIPCLLTLVKENNEDFHIDCISVKKIIFQ